VIIEDLKLQDKEKARKSTYWGAFTQATGRPVGLEPAWCWPGVGRALGGRWAGAGLASAWSRDREQLCNLYSIS